MASLGWKSDIYSISPELVKGPNFLQNYPIDVFPIGPFKANSSSINMQAVFLLVLVAFATLCNSQFPGKGPCRVDADCKKMCPNSGGVCTRATRIFPWKLCRCHTKAKRSFWEMSCKTDAECKQRCKNSRACCHVDHCHCNGGCIDHQG